MIYITSDLHFCHDRPFIYEPRGFQNVEEMNKTILSNWNSLITDEDDVYILGDIMLKDNINGLKFLHQLRGKIHIILGNHDTDERIRLYNESWNVVEITYAQRLKYKKYHFFLTHYPTETGNLDDDKPLKKRIINLCGHIHTNNPLEQWGKHPIFHVEMDTNNCTPWLLDDIIEILKAQNLDN